MIAVSIRAAARVSVVVLAASAATAFASPPPTLTAAGIAKGFTLSNIVTGLPPSASSSFNVLGSSINSAGQIVVNVSGASSNYVFNNLNNQVTANALSSTPFSGFPSAFAFSNGSVWASAVGGRLARLNNDGSVAQTYANIVTNAGMWTNQANGHLIAYSSGTLIDIDVSGAAPTFTTVVSSFSADGVTVSPDGNFAYGSSGQIVNLLTRANAGSFGSVSGADGMGVISSTNADLDGDIIVNTTNGNIVLVDHVTFVQTVIASGGGYGDFTSPDYTNGSLMLSSSNNLIRLSCGEGCGIGSAPPPVSGVPEPETYALMLAGLGVVGWMARRRRA